MIAFMDKVDKYKILNVNEINISRVKLPLGTLGNIHIGGTPLPAEIKRKMKLIFQSNNNSGVAFH